MINYSFIDWRPLIYQRKIDCFNDSCLKNKDKKLNAKNAKKL